ncbi:hypothetical protein Agub_g7317 [Astrephomene gubernaculifera]|uniref:Sulfotransferase n=1 Tax=Astrephomene gubernaculifera TaxID=47775 RepID=A0AAD3DPW1_9CHLO|nr:hypothetical protein Agub_g7317 [Astrephomene gubernaculifera]
MAFSRQLNFQVLQVKHPIITTLVVALLVLVRESHTGAAAIVTTTEQPRWRPHSLQEQHKAANDLQADLHVNASESPQARVESLRRHRHSPEDSTGGSSGSGGGDDTSISSANADLLRDNSSRRRRRGLTKSGRESGSSISVEEVHASPNRVLDAPKPPDRQGKSRRQQLVEEFLSEEEEQVADASPAAAATPAAKASSGEVSERCVIVLGTGRSGSTSLMDSLNQLPNYFIRGEQEAAFYHLFMTWRMLKRSWYRSREFNASIQAFEARRGPGAAAHLRYGKVKEVYDKYAVKKKLPWFNDLHPERLLEAVRGFYAATYGYHGAGTVSGFKEVRFVRGRALTGTDASYQGFVEFVHFLRMLCLDVKVLLNSRASASLDDNYKLVDMLERNGVLEALHADNATFVRDLEITHGWYDRYAAEYPDHAFRVIMEDMFDAKKNATLARRLLSFLGEDPATPIRFDRMPSWSRPNPRSKAAAGRQEPDAAGAKRREKQKVEGVKEEKAAPARWRRRRLRGNRYSR